MNRRDFIKTSSVVAAGSMLGGGLTSLGAAPASGGVTLSGHRLKRPLAITMWDFSWLERRWPGAGYEDWDQALDELKARGYDAVPGVLSQIPSGAIPGTVYTLATAPAGGVGTLLRFSRLPAPRPILRLDHVDQIGLRRNDWLELCS